MNNNINKLSEHAKERSQTAEVQHPFPYQLNAHLSTCLRPEEDFTRKA